MQQNYEKDSFEIGDEFEQFVENTIFTKDRYALIHRTSSKKENDKRYPESASKPDFHFRCLETGQEFYVEAKYRSSAIDNKVLGLKLNQEIRFKKLNKEVPVYVIIGYWGQPSNPSKLSFMRLEECKFRYLYTYYLANFEINKETLPNHLLKLENEKEVSIQQDSKKETVTIGQEIKHIFKTNPKLFGLAMVGLFAIILTIFSFTASDESSKVEPKDRLKEIVADYYQSMNSNQIEKLPTFLSPKIVSWYGDKKPTKEKIMRNAKAHRGKYPYSSSEIDWDSFKVIEESNGDYHVSYEMIYRAKQDISDDYSVFDLKLITKWDANFKLKSITEIRR